MTDEVPAPGNPAFETKPSLGQSKDGICVPPLSSDP